MLSELRRMYNGEDGTRHGVALCDRKCKSPRTLLRGGLNLVADIPAQADKTNELTSYKRVYTLTFSMCQYLFSTIFCHRRLRIMSLASFSNCPSAARVSPSSRCTLPTGINANT